LVRSRLSLATAHLLLVCAAASACAVLVPDPACLGPYRHAGGSIGAHVADAAAHLHLSCRQLERDHRDCAGGECLLIWLLD
jgi:hypothetical protein